MVTAINRIGRIFLLSGILFLLLIGNWGQTGVMAESNEDIMIIGNPNLPESTVSKVDLQNIFLGKKTEMGGAELFCAILKEGLTHEIFLKNYLTRTPSQYDKYWKKIIFTGQGKAPKVLDSEAEMLTYVKQTAGAIGYISAQTGSQNDVDGVKQLKIE
jgi:ABC-type phosphate transport system substrate-binding protein